VTVGRGVWHSESKPWRTERCWLQVARGGIGRNGRKLERGDGAAISDAPKVTVKGRKHSEVLWFDLA
jgi:redox-sensitive bicupin YhaK (pirin superfamily)